MPRYSIRLFGDPVLTQRAAEVDEMNGALARLADDMLNTMYEAPGLGLAAPQVGVQRRLFVYDVGDGPQTIVNPVISESRGEWVYEEGCLSVPGLSWDIVRPKEIHLTGYDLDGNEVSVEADELVSRLFQHELDHLDGVLLIERLEVDQRKAAMRSLREMTLRTTNPYRPTPLRPAPAGRALPSEAGLPRDPGTCRPPVAGAGGRRPRRRPGGHPAGQAPGEGRRRSSPAR